MYTGASDPAGLGTDAVIDVSEERFEELVSEALDSLPPEFASHIDNVAVMVEDGTTESPLLGLYQGIPLTKRTAGYSGVTPDRITIFRLPILARSRTEDDVREQVRRTVLHEVGHYFGIGDGRLRELGW
jgi:predicted Zn-dependent protease with MMP-like domain